MNIQLDINVYTYYIAVSDTISIYDSGNYLSCISVRELLFILNIIVVSIPSILRRDYSYSNILNYKIDNNYKSTQYIIF